MVEPPATTGLEASRLRRLVYGDVGALESHDKVSTDELSAMVKLAEKIDELASTSSRDKDVESNALDPLGQAVVKAGHLVRLSSRCD